MCAARCGSIGDCGFPAPACIAMCKQSSVFAGCLGKIAVDNNRCNAASSCLFLPQCGAVPHGNWSCNQTAQCQGTCNGNAACGCACMTNMAPSHAFVLAALDLCAGTVCNFYNNCVVQNCGLPLQVCVAQ